MILGRRRGWVGKRLFKGEKRIKVTVISMVIVLYPTWELIRPKMKDTWKAI